MVINSLESAKADYGYTVRELAGAAFDRQVESANSIVKKDDADADRWAGHGDETVILTRISTPANVADSAASPDDAEALGLTNKA